MIMAMMITLVRFVSFRFARSPLRSVRLNIKKSRMNRKSSKNRFFLIVLCYFISISFLLSSHFSMNRLQDKYVYAIDIKHKCEHNENKWDLFIQQTSLSLIGQKKKERERPREREEKECNMFFCFINGRRSKPKAIGEKRERERERKKLFVYIYIYLLDIHFSRYIYIFLIIIGIAANQGGSSLWAD